MSGVIGVGVTIGGVPACFIVENHLARFVECQDVRNVELMWDQMWRGSINYGRKGLVIQAISAVDLALWDALGIQLGQPIYQLLGASVLSSGAAVDARSRQPRPPPAICSRTVHHRSDRTLPSSFCRWEDKGQAPHLLHVDAPRPVQGARLRGGQDSAAVWAR